MAIINYILLGSWDEQKIIYIILRYRTNNNLYKQKIKDKIGANNYKKEGKYFVYKNKRITRTRKTIRKIRTIWRTKFIKCRTISYYYKKPEQKKKHQYN